MRFTFALLSNTTGTQGEFMKFVSYKCKGEDGYGILDNNHVFELKNKEGLPPSLLSFIEKELKLPNALMDKLSHQNALDFLNKNYK